MQLRIMFVHAGGSIWKMCFVFLILFVTESLSLSGPNVCSKLVGVEKWRVVEYKRPYMYRTHDFCWDLYKGFRCERNKVAFKTSQRNESYISVELQSVCCDGYAEMNDTCIRNQPCSHGHCSSPESCTCLPGWGGKQCNKSFFANDETSVCLKSCSAKLANVSSELLRQHHNWKAPIGNVVLHFENSFLSAACENGASCDPVSGECFCRTGYRGRHCTLACSEGTYGENCAQLCHCKFSYDRQYGILKINDNVVQLDFRVIFFHFIPLVKRCEKKCAGRHGQDCQWECQCKNNGQCDHITGICECTPGWTGILCDQPCPPGKYGSNCSLTCECQNEAVCDPINGTCHCQIGFSGFKCEQPCQPGYFGLNCTQVCDCDNAKYCRPSDGKCICNDGFHGDKCENRVCPHDRHGVNCSSMCPCVMENTKMCHPVTGKCYCKAGWTGLTCNEICPTYMYGENCRNLCQCKNDAYCDAKTGACICQPGFHGDKCELPCETGKFGRNCLMNCTCQNDGICIGTTGECSCKPGWTGIDCDLPCPAGRYGDRCNQTCPCGTPPNGCTPVDGVCHCAAGYVGKHCELVCQPGKYGLSCMQNCSCQPVSCNPFTGMCICDAGKYGLDCLSACKDGFYGEDCSKQCHCSEHGTCDELTGDCICQPGYMGAQCERCIIIQITLQKVSHCHAWIIVFSACPVGMYGKNCEMKCQNCVHSDGQNCHPDTGQCLCLPGYQGVHCEHACSAEYYGRKCSERCRCNLAFSFCHHVTGECQCFPGKTGADCSEDCPEGTFGRSCAQQCMECFNGGQCDAIDGTCICRAGFAGPRCETPCPAGTWYIVQEAYFFLKIFLPRGVGCVNQCNCTVGAFCNGTNGNCHCPAGLHGVFCDEYCPFGKYGPNCAKSCKCSAFAKGCHPITGVCVCPSGFIGSKCETVCQPNTYGTNCKEICQCKPDEICHPSIGCCKGAACPSGIMLPFVYDGSSSTTGLSTTVAIVVTVLILVVFLLVLLVGHYRKKYMLERDPPLPSVRYSNNQQCVQASERSGVDNPLYDPFAQKSQKMMMQNNTSEDYPWTRPINSGGSGVGGSFTKASSFDDGPSVNHEKMKLKFDDEDDYDDEIQSEQSGVYAVPDYERMRYNYGVVGDNLNAPTAEKKEKAWVKEGSDRHQGTAPQSSFVQKSSVM
ncbi:Multiple epidermal growth factor-like domains protein 11 [Trichinella spiralis]|uniref:Multiple epidermal growth factor-like domains protein 11 n=1 Tax=Trichinella spiralis TaxID=6334 RepID=A0A0V1BFM0_TRISP|nr:Multiple epidermal growth factor-like domains protein 11 [Trichinella spiralis]